MSNICISDSVGKSLTKYEMQDKVKFHILLLFHNHLLKTFHCNAAVPLEIQSFHNLILATKYSQRPL